ncbi:hypothetical protein [Anaerotignum lactatifermentans]|uniref:hypothetical protein n=1 Tax=Anaerotignum lactatifermentans TaxID=160404 RepID=UPI0039F5B835
MKFTENFNLNLPDLDDMADVEKLNENFQTIDTNMKSLETDPELAANVVDIKNKIGTEADADTQPTLFGRLAQLKNVLVEKLAEVLTKVTGIDGKIGTSGDAAGTETLFGQVKDISEKMPTGTVKSVQRGYIQLTDNSDPTEMQITISKIDPQKSFVILNTNAIAAHNDSYYGQGLCLKSLTENKLVVRSETRGSIWFSWQVIECF